MSSRRSIVSATGLLLATVAVVGILSLTGAGRAVADPSCTVTWTGGAGDNAWTSAANWSTGVVPSDSDVACIPSGNTVEVQSGTASAATVLADGATVDVSGGELDIDGSDDASTVGTLSISGGVLQGAATVNVTGAFSWSDGTMGGSGATVLGADATGEIQPASSSAKPELDTRTLQNGGTLTVDCSQANDATGTFSTLTGADGAQLQNDGTLDLGTDASDQSCELAQQAGATSALTNDGTLDLQAEQTVVGWGFQNTASGDITVGGSGQMDLLAGQSGSSAEDGTWEGTGTLVLGAGGQYAFAADSAVSLASLSVQPTPGSSGGQDATFVQSVTSASPTAASLAAGAVSWPSTTVSVTGTAELGASSGTTGLQGLSVSRGGGVTLLGTAQIGSVSVAGGTLTSGDLSISDALSWTGGTMHGSGTTTVQAGATGTIEPQTNADPIVLDGQDLTNDGTLTLDCDQATDPSATYSTITGSNGAQLDNAGTLQVDSVDADGNSTASGCALQQGSGAASILTSDGTVDETGPSVPIYVGWEFSATSDATFSSVQLLLAGGLSSGQQIAGTWQGSSLELVSGGTYALSPSIALGDNAADSASLVVDPAPASEGSGYQDFIDWLAGADSAPTLSLGAVDWPDATVVDDGSLTVGATGQLTTLENFVDQQTTSVAGNLTVRYLDGGGDGVQLSVAGNFTAQGFYPDQTTFSIGGDMTVSDFTGTDDYDGTNDLADTVGGSLNVTGNLYAGDATQLDVTGAVTVSGDYFGNETKGLSVGGALTVEGDYFEDASGDVNTEVSAHGPITIGQSFFSGNGNGVAILEGTQPNATITGGNGMTIAGSFYGGSDIFDISGTLAINGSDAYLEGTDFQGGGTVDLPATAYAGGILDGVTMVNTGELYLDQLQVGEDGAQITNTGVIDGGGGALLVSPSATPPTLDNQSGGSLIDNQGSTPSLIQWAYLGSGSVQSGAYELEPHATAQYGTPNPAQPLRTSTVCGDVVCSTGDLTEAQTDLKLNGLGGPLALTRTYNSELANAQLTPGLFGFGWTTAWDAHLYVNTTSGSATVQQGNGSLVQFTAAGGQWTSDAATQATLTTNSDGTYSYTLPNQDTLTFAASGQLVSETDRAGNSTQLTYGAGGQLSTLTAPSGRAISLTYNSAGLVASAGAPGAATIDYEYDDNDNLVSVSVDGSSSAPLWQFSYGSYGTHLLTAITNAQGNTTAIYYNNAESGQATALSQPDAEQTSWNYEAGETVETSPAGNVTQALFDSDGNPLAVTRGYGTSQQTTETAEYNSADEMTQLTDGAGNTASYGYDAAGDLTSLTDANGEETQWSYDGAHDVTSMTSPSGETTTYSYNADHILTGLSRPGPSGTTLATAYAYNSDGQPTSLTDPRGDTTAYGYDAAGDLTSVTGPTGEETTYAYDNDGHVVSMVAPAGNASDGDPLDFTTAYGYDARGRLISVTDPLGHETTYAYDADSNLTALTDPDGNTTNYAYHPDGQLAAITRADGTTIAYSYDGDGNVIAKTDGDGAVTSYAYTPLDQLTSETDPLQRQTSYAYDAAGNLITVTDPDGNITSYSYNPGRELTMISYSDGSTPDVSYTYNPDGTRAAMTDATGTTSYSYDVADRLTSQTNGAGQTVSYGYDPDGDVTSIGYPDGHTVAQAYDADDRLTSVTDWLGNTTSFAYTPDSQLQSTTYPAATGDVDTYGYNDGDQLTSVTMDQASTTLASLTDTRDPTGLLSSESQTGLPGVSSVAYSYTALDQLASAGSDDDAYDAAGDITELDGSSGYAYDVANELTASPTLNFGYSDLGQRDSQDSDGPPPTPSVTVGYSYDSLGRLTTVTQSQSPTATSTGGSYSFDQTGRLMTVTPASGSATSFTYDGDGLRASETVGSTIQKFAWDEQASTPRLLTDGSEDYVYGPGNLPIEQVDAAGQPTYLHYDQLGSIRLITDQSGSAVASFTYTPYGTVSASSGTATSAFGYAGQYTDPTTGLQYEQSRYYDPATGQFLTPISSQPATQNAPYIYASDSPVNQTEAGGTQAELPSTLTQIGQTQASATLPDAAQEMQTAITTPNGPPVEPTRATADVTGAMNTTTVTSIPESSPLDQGDESEPPSTTCQTGQLPGTAQSSLGSPMSTAPTSPTVAEDMLPASIELVGGLSGTSTERLFG